MRRKLRIVLNIPVKSGIVWDPYWKRACYVLGVMLFLQVSMFLSSYISNSENRREYEDIKTRLDEVEKQKAKLVNITIDNIGLAGAMIERNQWFEDRTKSPLRILARLEQTRPVGADLRYLECSKLSGSLKILSPDMETAAEWVHAAIGKKSEHLTVEDRVEGRLLVFYSWVE